MGDIDVAVVDVKDTTRFSTVARFSVKNAQPGSPVYTLVNDFIRHYTVKCVGFCAAGRLEYRIMLIEIGLQSHPVWRNNAYHLYAAGDYAWVELAFRLPKGEKDCDIKAALYAFYKHVSQSK